MIKLFEAFSGYGSQALALKRYNVEFESVGIAEIDKYAIEAHEALHGTTRNYGDVSKLHVDELPNMDLFTYSFPCQDISNAGKQRGLGKGSGTRSSLLWECERIIEGKLPKFLMMENVKNLVGKQNKPHFDEWLQILENLGYNNYWKVINAKWCGVPQNRERVFCVSIRKDIDNGLFSFYEDFDNGIRLKDILETEVDEKYYLSDKKTNGLIEAIELKGYENPQEAYTTDDRSYCIDSNYHKGTSSGDVGKCRRTQIIVKEATKQGYKEAYPGDSINLEHPDSKTRRGRVGDQIAQTLTTSCNQATLEYNYRIRKLTPKECLRLMGLSDKEIEAIQSTSISNSQQYKLAGNSIVVDCMRFLKKLGAIDILNEDKPKLQLSLF